MKITSPQEIRAKEKLKKEKLALRSMNKKVKKQFSRSKLIKEADRVLSLYIRYERDKLNPCITCGLYCNEYDNGHFQSRRFINTRWCEMNVAKQCCRCNKWLSGEQVVFGRKIDERWGEGTAEAIEILARKLSVITDEDILHTIQVYYSLLSHTDIIYSPKKQFQGI